MNKEKQYNIQVIDGAMNCTYDVFSVNTEDFFAIFPDENQDVEFSDDFVNRVGEDRAINIFNKMWESRCDKKKINGLHGTLFFDMEYKKIYYPTKNSEDKNHGF